MIRAFHVRRIFCGWILSVTEEATADVLIIGVGNEFRGDDGVGLLVARNLELNNIQNFQVMELPGEGTELMQVWQERERVIVIDASQSGMQPGEIVRLDAGAGPLPTGFFSYSTHAFGLAEAVETSRNLRNLPNSLIIFAIEGQNFAQGSDLSDVVLQSIKTVSDAVRSELRDT